MEKCIGRILEVYKNYLGIDDNQEAILRYSLYLMMSAILGYFLALAAAWLLGTFSYVFVIMITISILRSSSGGAHCESMWNCAIFGMVVSNALGLLIKVIVPTKEITLSILVFVFLFGLWSINKYAPADTPQKPINTFEKREKLKRRSLVILVVWCFLNIGYYIIFKRGHSMVIASSLGVLWQCFSITKVGYKLWHKSDCLLNKILGK
ncbi:accessory gene regulator ArgB-like protein [Crassaminicella indica]|uniref:Accessory gene regulator B family protein n=1 Tax=Crassaminicella indica TaxID=2855394 RepID=A0ABX8RHJ2_9CLOT|nr:accessory gene regulator B family protein [Crassaminicella indica]QXM07195.1 accessory gene regulator B family protein [Crassaminicella indica]